MTFDCVRPDRPLQEQETPPEDDSPMEKPVATRSASQELMNKELNDEGVGIRAVGDRRSYRLQGDVSD